MGRISALTGIRRFRIGEVKHLVASIERHCHAGVHADEQAALLVTRAQRGWPKRMCGMVIAS